MTRYKQLRKNAEEKRVKFQEEMDKQLKRQEKIVKGLVGPTFINKEETANEENLASITQKNETKLQNQPKLEKGLELEKGTNLEIKSKSNEEEEKFKAPLTKEEIVNAIINSGELKRVPKTLLKEVRQIKKIWKEDDKIIETNQERIQFIENTFNKDKQSSSNKIRKGSILKPSLKRKVPFNKASTEIKVDSIVSNDETYPSKTRKTCDNQLLVKPKIVDNNLPLLKEKPTTLPNDEPMTDPKNCIKPPFNKAVKENKVDEVESNQLLVEPEIVDNNLPPPKEEPTTLQNNVATDPKTCIKPSLKRKVPFKKTVKETKVDADVSNDETSTNKKRKTSGNHPLVEPEIVDNNVPLPKLEPTTVQNDIPMTDPKNPSKDQGERKKVLFSAPKKKLTSTKQSKSKLSSNMYENSSEDKSINNESEFKKKPTFKAPKGADKVVDSKDGKKEITFKSSKDKHRHRDNDIRKISKKWQNMGKIKEEDTVKTDEEHKDIVKSNEDVHIKKAGTRTCEGNDFDTFVEVADSDASSMPNLSTKSDVLVKVEDDETGDQSDASSLDFDFSDFSHIAGKEDEVRSLEE